MNKVDRATDAQVLERLDRGQGGGRRADRPIELADVEYFPVSARTGEGVDGLTRT